MIFDTGSYPADKKYKYLGNNAISILGVDKFGLGV